jgi:tripartite-type tricarboxylate transporter receptor subunit TctC
VPEEIAQAISASMSRALNDEAFRASLTKIGFWPLRARDEAGIKDLIDADKARWSNVIRKLNMSLD